MGWIGIGILLFGGGYLLYRHPPPALRVFFSAPGQTRAAPIPRPDKQGKDAAASKPENKKETSIPEPNGGPRVTRATEWQTRTQTPELPCLNPPTFGSMPPPPRLNPPTFSSMPPPPRPISGPSLRPPPSAASSLRVPTTRPLSNAAFAPSRLSPSKPKSSRQVTLAPGHSPLDWAALTTNPSNNLRGHDAGPNNLIRVPPSRLKAQNGRRGRDAWTEYQGKVYNITPYLPFHPGGQGELMRGAGRDAGKLFMEVHPWVNWDGMLGECLVGILVAEGDGEGQRGEGHVAELDSMD